MVKSHHKTLVIGVISQSFVVVVPMTKEAMSLYKYLHTLRSHLDVLYTPEYGNKYHSHVGDRDPFTDAVPLDALHADVRARSEEFSQGGVFLLPEEQPVYVPDCTLDHFREVGSMEVRAYLTQDGTPYFEWETYGYRQVREGVSTYKTVSAPSVNVECTLHPTYLEPLNFKWK